MATVLARGRITIAKIDDGYTITLAPASVSIPTNADGTAPVLTAAKTKVLLSRDGISVPITITAVTPTGCMASFSGNVVSITGIPNNIDTGEVLIEFKASDNSYSSSAVFSFAKAKQGGQGNPGADAYTAVLSNESHSIPASSTGEVTTAELAKAISKIIIYRGAVALAPVAANATPGIGQFRYNIASVTGGTANRIDNESFVLASMTAASTIITVSIICENKTTITKVMTVTKALAGQQGTPGKDIPSDTVDDIYADMDAILRYADQVAINQANVAKADAIRIASEDAEAKATAARKAAEDMAVRTAAAIRIGGRNYYRQSSNLVTWNGAVLHERKASGFRVAGVYQNNGVLRIENVIDGNGWYTVSFDVQTEQVDWANNELDLGDGTKHYYTARYNQWRRVEYTYEVTNFQGYNHFVDLEGLSGQVYEFKDIMIVKGTKAMDYVPAPEDVSAAIKDANDKAKSADDKYNWLTSQLKTLAYNDLADLAVNGQTLIKNGKVNTVLLDAQAVRTNILTAGYISTLEIVSKVLRTAESGARIEISGNSLNSYHVNGTLARAQTIEGGIVKDIWYNEGGNRVMDLSYKGWTYVVSIPESWAYTPLLFLSGNAAENADSLSIILNANACYKPNPEYNSGRNVGAAASVTAYYYSAGKNQNSDYNTQFEGYKTSSGSRSGNNIANGWYILANTMYYTGDGDYYDLMFQYVNNGKVTNTISANGVYLNATYPCNF